MRTVGFLPCAYHSIVLKRQADIVQTVQQALAALRVNGEGGLGVYSRADRLALLLRELTGKSR